MMLVTAFLCALSILPADCGRDNAIVVEVLGEAPNEIVCQRDSQMTLASIAIAAGEDFYWKVSCTRSNRGMGVIG